VSPVVVKGADTAAAALRRFRFGTIASEFGDTVIPTIVEALKAEAPYRETQGTTNRDGSEHRHLRDSISGRRETSTSSMQLIFTSDVPQAAFVVRGTRPHIIQGRPVLHWLDDGGNDVFARTVHHPGTKPNRFNVRAWRAVEALVVEELKVRMRALLEL
jgi:hypothetical protein